MGFSLENLFASKTTVQQNMGMDSSKNVMVNPVKNYTTGTQTTQSMQALFDLLKDIMSGGDTLQGKVLSLEGDSIELLLPNGQNITANLEKGVSIQPGEQILFSVKSLQENRVELKPLFTNTNHTSTITKALEEASLPIQEKNVIMVEEMMERGMKIQKNALWDMKRMIHQFPKANIEDIITLKSLNLPVTQENLEQISLYKKSENEILMPLKEMVETIPKTIENMASLGKSEEAIAFCREIIQFPEQLNVTRIPVEMLNEDENVQFKLFLEKAGFSQQEIENLMERKPDEKLVLDVIRTQILDNPKLSKEVVTKLFKEPFFQDITQKFLMDSMAIKPEEVKKQDNIEMLYKTLYEKAGKVLETLSGKEEMPLLKAAQNLKANVDFVQQINQIFSYVQLPLKFSESHANGELFVYGNGKKLSLEEGDVTAFLHLSMEHLGNVDIHVEMNGEKQVKTNFYFEKEEMLDFIYDHIDMLNDRLEKRGYGPVTKVHLKDKDQISPIEEVFEKKKETGILLSTQSFDALA